MMKYKCVITTREKWLSAAKDCPYATYFHTPYWYDIIVPNQTHIPLEITFDDGASAIIPIAKIKRMGGLLVNHFSSPGGNYGGWISTSPLNHEHVKILLDILTSKKNLTFRANPFFTPQQPSLQTFATTPLAGGKNFIDDHTHIIDLTNGVQEFQKKVSKGHRDAVRYAVRNGVTIRPAETLEDWERYYAVYQGSIKRWRESGAVPKTVYPWPLLKRIYENNTGNETLWLAFKDGAPVAGSLFFYWRAHVVAWHGAADAEHFGLRPNNLLYWEAVSDAARRGYAVFDFNPSGGYSGVESFKESFGAVKMPSPILHTRTGGRLMVKRLRGWFKLL